MASIRITRDQAELCDKFIDFMLRDDQFNEMMDINKAKEAIGTSDNDLAYLIMSVIEGKRGLVEAVHFKEKHNLQMVPQLKELTRFRNGGGFVAMWDEQNEQQEKDEYKEQLETRVMLLEEKVLTKQDKTHSLSTWTAIGMSAASLLWQIVDSCNK